MRKEIIFVIIFPPYIIGTALKRKNLLRVGVTYFILRVALFGNRYKENSCLAMPLYNELSLLADFVSGLTALQIRERQI